MVPAIKHCMAELKKGQIGQLPSDAESKDWLCSEKDMMMKIKNGDPWTQSHSEIENSAHAHTKKRQLFLKWCLTNMLTVAIIFLATAFGATQTQNLSLVGKAMVLAIVMHLFYHYCLRRINFLEYGQGFRRIERGGRWASFRIAQAVGGTKS